MSTTTLDTTTVRRWKRYPEFRDLPLDWALSIPAHWKTRRLKEVASVRPSNVDKKSVEGEQAVRLCNYVDVYKNDRITGAMDFMAATATDAQIQQFSIRGGDVIVTKDSETWDDIAVPAYVPQTIEGLVCGYHLALIRPDARHLDGAYLARCFAAEGVCDQFRVAANGITRHGLDTQSIKCAVIPVPPLPEQRAIASFLDREAARIDALIERKERLIALLEEKRQAVISHAVTRGLDPAAPLKDSGVPWLGMVPSHWGLTRMKHLVRAYDGIQMGPFGGMLKELEETEADYKLYGQENTISNDFDAGGRWLSHEHYIALRAYELRPGDIVLTRKGASIGNCRVVPPGIIPGVIDSDTIRMRFDPGMITTDYAVLLLHEGYLETEILAMQKGAVLPGLNTTTISSLRVALPPVAEQRAILRTVQERCTPLDTLMSQVRSGIARLQEYRTALISAAVTGQIDVRGEVSP
jgi:type I restriction enzyme, S subunit